ncbi:MAG: hypothetical protein QI223_02090, partial [Candidatus Korarchaeota archaeon]|nr:hypothetical protein [Candidatus Korarchaeota archaeon]
VLRLDGRGMARLAAMLGARLESAGGPEPDGVGLYASWAGEALARAAGLALEEAGLRGAGEVSEGLLREASDLRARFLELARAGYRPGSREAEELRRAASRFFRACWYLMRGTHVPVARLVWEPDEGLPAWVLRLDSEGMAGLAAGLGVGLEAA